MQKLITLTGPTSAEASSKRKVNFQDIEMKIFRFYDYIMMYQDTLTSIIQTLLT